MRTLLALVAKDLRRERRSGEMATALVVFGAILTAALAFALPARTGPEGLEAAAGALWAAVILAVAVALGRAVEGERADGRLRYLRAAPVEPATLYAAKAAAVLLLAAAAEACLAVPFAVLFGVPAAGLARAAPAVLAGTAGLGASGTLLALVASHGRAREVLLPVLLLPIALPVVIAGVEATSAAFAGEPAGPWPAILVAFVLLSSGASALLAPAVLEE